MDDLRFRSQTSPRNESPMNSLVSPPRNGSRLPGPQVAHDHRSNLPRRFTTDSGRVPTLNSMASIASPPARGPEQPQDYNTMHKVQLIEKKKIEYERIREQRRRFELEMQKLDQQQRREALELAQMEEEVGRLGGHQSEPTTPPEYRDNNSGFPSMFSRPNRYSTSSLTSPPGLFNRPARSGSQLQSPQSGIMQTRFGFEDQQQMPSRSVPTTRRNSDDEKEEAVRQDPTSHRATNALNRYSMPVTRSRTGLYDVGLDQTNTTRFLFGDEEPSALGHVSAADENFPTLVRRDDQILSASSAALDLALAPSPKPDIPSSRGWSRVVNRHRPQQSLSSINGSTGQISDTGGMNSRPSSVRHSLDLKYISENSNETGGSIMPSPGNQNMATPPKLQSSFSANDVPTVKNPAGSSMNANNHAQLHFHNHNASLGRIPVGAVPRGHTRELSAESVNTSREQAGAFQSIQTALQASAAPFGPSTTTAAPPASAHVSSPSGNPSMSSFNNGFYQANGYHNPNPNHQGAPHPASPFNVSMLAAGMQQMNINGANGGGMYPQQNYPGYGSLSYGQGNQPRDSQARVIQHRRQLDNEAMSRYQNMPLESAAGQIYELCKDQHGCRYLQKKLEERNADQVHMIWLETNQHVIELMTDPFGNYLCQKLLEFCNDDERTILIQNASQDMVRIALNQHGTRALQKMIEYVSTPQQVLLIIEALRFRVVELIQDLNGNHVIQKCLNKLTALDAQFIFDAVGNNCVEVGTHRHGCCVLQRCIDHASGDQKLWLIQRITEHARILVQDPFGNYVVQYIIDLNEPTFTEPVVRMFRGCVTQLSRHKFSSNVIEKCLRCSQPESRDMIVEELLVPAEMERLLRDSFANYVIQTALEYATPHQKYRLVESIRPILPQIRTTPYGRRIQAKISAFDSRGSAASSGQATPADNTQGQIPLRQAHSRGLSGGPMTQSNGVANGGLSGLGNQGIRQGMPTYPNNSALAVSTPGTAGGPVQAPPQFAQRPPGNFSPSRSTNGSGSVNSNGNSNGNLTENGETHWV
ncbi:armadillo-type protein [Dactylonectria estremocensis]|uniref:Armadillo-type protein n=1 Tax=Dactylonectria estremocensis TaxID=1079267 RepID=A0A9P9F717_9HYPO|nr:armadillo-type protein [Dactylonectria estremocensis]